MMFDIMKKRKSRRIAQPYSEMPSKKEMHKLLLLSCFGMKKKKKLRSETHEDYVRLNKIEQSNHGIGCSLIHDCDGSVGDSAVSLETKQNKKSFADHGTAKEPVDCEMTTTFSSQDSLQKPVHIIRTCKVTVYPDVSFQIEHKLKNVQKNDEKYIRTSECCNFQPEFDAKMKGMQNAFQLNICRPEMCEDIDESFNKKPTAIVLPTRHQTNTIAVVSPLSVERNTHELESALINIDHETVVKTDENGHSCTSHGSYHMEPGSEYESEDTFVKDICSVPSRLFEHTGTGVPYLHERDYTSFEQLNLDTCGHFFSSDGSSNMTPDLRSQSENTVFEDMDCSSILSPRFIGDNDISVPFLPERDNTAFMEYNFCSFDSFTSAGLETVPDMEDVRNCPRNDNYSGDQKSRNADRKEAVAGIQMFCQTDVQHQDIQDSRLVHSVDLQSPQKSGHSPHSIRVRTPQEGQNISHHPQMFTKLDHDIDCSSSYDMSDLCTVNITVAKLVQKVDQLQTMIDRLSKLVFLAVSSNSRIPNRMKKQDIVISQYQENCKTCLYDDDMKCYIKENMRLVTSPPDNSFIIAECREQMGHCSTACVCLADNTLDLESLQYNRARQVPPATNVYILADKMNNTRSAIMGQGEAMKTKKMHKVPKDLTRGELANQPITMLKVERPLWHKETVSDEIGHTLSLQISSSEENLQQSLHVTQNLEAKAKLSSLRSELNSMKSFPGERNCSVLDEMINIKMDDVETHGPDLLQFKAIEEKDQNHNEDKSRCLSEAIMAQSIVIGHTKKTSVENSNNDAQLEMATNSTTPESTRAVDSSGYSEKDYTDSGDVLRMDSMPTFINSDPSMSLGRESVKDKMWNKLNLEQDEAVVSTSKLNLEAADGCFNADSVHDSCLNQKENVMGLSSSVLKMKETDCCLNMNASDVSCLHQMDCNINVTADKTVSLLSSSEVDPVISDPEMYRQMQVSVGYSSHQCLQVQDKSKDKFTAESQSVQDSSPEKTRANEFVSRCKVQEGKLKETKCTSILNKKKSLRRSKLRFLVSCRLISLQRKRRGKKRKVKLKKNTELGRKVGHAENFPGILSDLKILLHCLTSSYTQDTAPTSTLTQASQRIKGKTYFATELGIVVSGKKNISQEQLIDDFLKTLVSPWFIFPTISSGLQRVILLPTGLQLYFERLLRGTPPEERERMSYEWLRLQTFINYPSSAPGSGIRLARAGFYYSGSGTVTVCYACGGQHSGWNFHDDPFEIHRRISPDCPFLRGNPTYPNVPIMQEREQNGIHMRSSTSNEPLSQTMVSSPSSSNRLSEISLPSEFQSQNSIITGAQSSAAAMPSIHNSQEGGSEQQASQKTMSKDERHLGSSPSSINPVSSAHIDEIPSVIHQPVTLTVAVAPNTSAESLQGQQPTTAASSVSQPQQPTDDAENTQYRNPGNFVLIKPAGQVEDPGVDPTPQTMSERPRHPEYAPLSSRVNSYTGWPARLDQTPQQMAEAGFYYAGVNDYTRCFQCGGGLRNWEPGDNPWIEHARWYPQCAYVLGKRGHRFVNAVLKKQAELLAAQNAQRNNSNTTTTINNTTINTTTTNTSSLSVSKTGIQEPTTQSGQPRYFQNPNENEIANRLINEMGYQRERVREAILEVKRSRGQQEIAVEHVIELLVADEERRARAGRQNEAATVEELIQESGRLTLHDDSNPPPAIPPPTEKATATTTQPGPLNHVAGNRSNGQQQNGQKSGQTNQTSAPGRAPSVPQSQRNMSGPMSIAVDVPSSSSIFSNQEGSQNNKSTASNRPLSSPLMEPTSLPAFDAESLREEYMRLRDQNMCKICMERSVELAFLPCGHLVCCEVCGQALRFCPICRAKIHASVKTYLS